MAEKDKRGFRKNLFGGFNRTDVIAYIAEKNQKQVEELAQTKRALAAAEERVAEALRNRDAVQNELDSTRRALEEAQAAEEPYRTQLAASRKAYETLQNRLTAVIGERDGLQSRLADSIEVRDTLQSRLDAAVETEAACGMLQYKLDTVTQERDALQKRFDDLFSGLRAVTGELMTETASVPPEDPRVAELAETVEQLSSENRRLAEEVQQLHRFRTLVKNLLLPDLGTDA